ncbi:ABC transporter ATP-binding protein/permease [Halomonas organivorans]
MLRSLHELYSLLTHGQRRRLVFLQILVVLMACAEVAAVVAIGPFMAIVGDISRLQEDGIIADIYNGSGFQDPYSFLFWLGIGVLITLTISTMISIYTVWRLSLYGQKIGAELSIRLYKHYMKQPWLFHSRGSSNQLTSKISQECTRITDKVIAPIMKMNAKVVMVTFMATAVFVFNPRVAVIGVLTFFASYVLLYRTVRKKLASDGQMISRTQDERFQLMAEGFGGIKDALLLGRQGIFNKRFEASSLALGRARGTSKGLSEVPRYAMELIAFGSVIFLILYLLTAHHGDLGKLLPVLSVYALAGLKLLPAFQQIYMSVSTIRSNLSAFDSIRDDLIASRYTGMSYSQDPAGAGRLIPQDSVALNNVSFRYPGKDESALSGLSLEIPANHVIGLVGPSGSGKSTAIDMLLGLIDPDEGSLTIDNRAITSDTKRAWQNSVGFVPQTIFLADASIRENIAFGLPNEQIDDVKVAKSVCLAHLDDLITSLPEGLDTRVGERGIQLSGGQRQRIGIARALYDDAKVLILDEATSALDGITEKNVMDAIHDFSGKKTIVMVAHRLATVRRCDKIYFIDNGHVVDSGSYDELVNNNVVFQKMAKYA